VPNAILAKGIRRPGTIETVIAKKLEWEPATELRDLLLQRHQADELFDSFVSRQRCVSIRSGDIGPRNLPHPFHSLSMVGAFGLPTGGCMALSPGRSVINVVSGNDIIAQRSAVWSELEIMGCTQRGGRLPRVKRRTTVGE